MLITVLAVMLAVGPGALLGATVPPGPERWAVWTAAPVLSLGLTSVAMAWLPAVGLPNSALWVLVAEVVLATGAVGARLVARHRAGGDRPPDPPDRLLTSGHRGDAIALAAATAVTIGFGRLLLGGLSEPPGWDGMNHALLTRMIMATGSTSISSACSTGSTHPAVACTFYPLAADVQWAQAAVLGGGKVGAAMTAWSTLIAPVLLVFAVFACVRALGASSVVAGCAAAATTLIGPLWTSVLTGRITEQAGPGLSVSVALVLALALKGRYPVRLGLIAGLGLAGVLMTHTYDVLFAGTLGLALVPFVAGPGRRSDLAKAVAATGVGAVVVVLPLARALLGAGGERVSAPPVLVGQFGAAIRYWLWDPQRYVIFGYPAPHVGPGGYGHALGVQTGLTVTVVALLCAPLSLAFRSLRWARPWLAVWAGWTVIGVWTSTSTSGLAVRLSDSWYGIPERLRTMILPVYGVLAVAGAGALGLCAQKAYRRLGGPKPGARWALAPAALAALVLVVVLAASGLPADSRRPLRQELSRRTLAGSSYPHLFAWLVDHTPSGDVVAYDRHLEFMTWSFADYGVPLLFGIPPLPTQNPSDYAGRYSAWFWLVNAPHAAPAGCLVRKYAIAYVVVGGARIPGWSVHYNRRQLKASKNVRLVHQDGALTVYQVTRRGRACPPSA